MALAPAEHYPEDRPTWGPRHAACLFGHDAAERAFIDAWMAGRLHHAWLLAGPRGIGKCTFAFRAARFLFHAPAPEGDGLFGAPPRPKDLFVNPEDPLFARVRSGGHSDLFTLEREPNEKTGVLRQEIVADDVRKVPSFFSRKAGEGGWRVCIVDEAEALNRTSANILLKILEEPPERAVIFLVANAPGRLLPTLRSRCRRLLFGPLGDDDMRRALRAADPVAADEAVEWAVRHGEGAPGAALAMLAAGGADLAAQVERLFAAERLDWLLVHALADKVGRRKDGGEGFEALRTLMGRAIAARARQAALAGAPNAAQLAAAAQDFAAHVGRAEALRVERKQALLSGLVVVEQALH